MKRILTAAALIPLVLALVFLGPLWLITLATAAVAALATWEYTGLAEKCGAKPSRIALLIAILGLFAARFLGDYLEWLRQTEVVFGFLALGLLVVCTFHSPVERMLADVSSSIFCLF